MLHRLKPYWQALLDVFKYQIVTKILIAVWIFLLGRLFQVLLVSTGRVAVTSGDFKFIFTSWQGILIILIGLFSLFIYVAFDINTKIVMSRSMLLGDGTSLRKSVKEGFLSIGKFMNVRGIGVILYIALIAPLLGFGMLISLTEGFYIPTFITSVIESTPLYLIGVTVLLTVFLVVGIANLYVLHGVVLDKLPLKEAGLQSKKLMRVHWKDYLKQNFLYILITAVLLAAVVAVFIILPLKIVYALSLQDGVRRILTILFMTAGAVISLFAGLFATPLYIMKMTQLFYSYKTGELLLFEEREKRKHPFVLTGLAAVVVGIIVVTFVMNRYFDEVFPLECNVGIVAHRAGGNEGPENTVAGLEAAHRFGAMGSEIDIQRTKDGFYVLNHDSTFARVAGDDRTPEEMTLEEVKALEVEGESVPTFEEMLQACKGKLILFTELKGNTADQQMADDAVRIIKEYNMEEECVLISLKYDLINYIESTYPEMHTGFLTFASFGNTAALNCDYLGLEEESATSDAIQAIHNQGKKALVWTSNERESQRHFLCSQADGLITDNVKQAAEIKTELTKRTDLQRIIDRFIGL